MQLANRGDVSDRARTVIVAGICAAATMAALIAAFAVSAALGVAFAASFVIVGISLALVRPQDRSLGGLLIGIAIAYSLLAVGIGEGYVIGIALAVGGALLVGRRLTSHKR